MDVPYKPAVVRAFYTAQALSRDRAHLLANVTLPHFHRARDIACFHDHIRAWFLARGHACVLAGALGRTILLARACDIGDTALSMLEIPNVDAPAETWNALAAQLQVMMHDWEFTWEQAQTLEDYFGAAEVLVKCLDVAYVTDREGIEARLVVPPREG